MSRLKMVVVVTILVTTAAGCRYLPTHNENGPSAFLDIVAFGDSFTAGNGAIGSQAQAGYYHYSDDDPRDTDDRRSTIRYKEWTYSLPDPHPYGCFRSHNNYSETLYRLLSSSGAYINGACSGDTTNHVQGDISGYPGQMGGFTTKEAAEVDLATITIGGNDLDFAAIMQQCFIGFSDDATECQQVFDSAIALLAGGTSSHIYGQMRSAFRSAHNAFPGAKIVLVGYPLLYEDPSLEISNGDIHVRPQILLETWLDQLNVQQQQLVDELNDEAPGDFAFLQLHEPDGPDEGEADDGFFDGHGIAGTGTPWINPPGNAAEFDFREEWYHPNALGHQKIAEALRDMPYVQQLLNDRIKMDYPKTSLSKVDGQWYALDNARKLWTVTADFVRCQVPNGPYKLVSWGGPQQLLTAAANSAPYPALPGQPGCNLSVPRAGDILYEPVSDTTWRVTYGPGGEKQRQRFADDWGRFYDADTGGGHVSDCLWQRGAQRFVVDEAALAAYAGLGGQFNDTTCWYGLGPLTDLEGNYWVEQQGPQRSAGYVSVNFINEQWMRDCMELPGGPLGGLVPGVDIHAEYGPGIESGITFLAGGFVDARCIT
jgi:lysophospholipase L1-like esterase